MVKHFSHQKKIGIIGATPDSQAFILEANKLGFETYLLCQSEEQASTFIGAIETFVGRLDDPAIHDNFLMKSDFLVYYDETINPSELANIQKTIIVPQGDDLLSIAQDRVLQKAFLESLSINIAPYVTVVKPEDIEQGIRSIGYPAVLRTNQINPENKDQTFFIYEEEDIQKAASLLKYGTCVLESWLVVEKEFSISGVKTGNGEVQLYPVAQREYRDNRLFATYLPEGLDEELLEEMNRVVRVILGEIDFRGVSTIDIIVTPTNALYVKNIYPYPTILSRHSAGSCSLSTTEAQLRAVTGLPIPHEIKSNASVLFLPFYKDQIAVIDEMLKIHPEWDFTFYPITKNKEMETVEAIGHAIIETTDPKRTIDNLKEKLNKNVE